MCYVALARNSARRFAVFGFKRVARSRGYRAAWATPRFAWPLRGTPGIANPLDDAELSPFRATAIRLTDQAVTHLEKGDQATALHEISEALEAANKAGIQGEK